MITKSGRGKPLDADTTRLARVLREEMHLNMYDRIVDALTTGVDVSMVDGISGWNAEPDELQLNGVRDARVSRLEALIAESKRKAQRATERSLEEHDEDVAADLLDESRKHHAEARRHTQELNRLESEKQAQAALSASAYDLDLHVPLNGLVKALSVLCGPNHRSAEGHLVQALRSVLQDFTFRVQGASLHWETYLLLPAVDGRVLRVGPISGEVPVVPSSRPGSRDAGDFAGLLDTVGSEGRGRIDKRAALVALGVPKNLSRIAAGHPLDFFHAVLGRALGDETVQHDPVDSSWDDLEWREHLTSSYRADSIGWHINRVAGVSPLWQSMADRLRDLGGQALVGDLISQGDIRGVSSLLKNDKFSDCFMPLFRLGPKAEPRSRHRERSISLVSCPHCGDWADRYLRLPEVPVGLLCPTCRRMPCAGSVTFPPEYLEITVAGALPIGEASGDVTGVRIVDEHGAWERRVGSAGSHRPHKLEAQVLALKSISCRQGATCREVQKDMGLGAPYSRAILAVMFERGVLERTEGYRPRYRVPHADLGNHAAR